MGLVDEMARYYENEGDEEARLQPGSVQYLEFITATRYLDRLLPPGAQVLDSCAGTGIYAFYLAGRGHRVTAGDLLGHNVARMRQKQPGNPPLADILQCDARDLGGFANGSFDAVLCMGALYHLPGEADRRRAVAEALRVLRPGGLLFATTMNRYAVIMNNLQPGLDNLDDMLRFARSGREGIFYAATAGEAEALMAGCGAEKVMHVCLDGMAYLLVHTARLVDPAAFDRWAEYHLAVCEDESLLGSSYHNLYIGRKPEVPEKP